jgi:hypothetical protein
MGAFSGAVKGPNFDPAYFPLLRSLGWEPGTIVRRFLRPMHSLRILCNPADGTHQFVLLILREGRELSEENMRNAWGKRTWSGIESLPETQRDGQLIWRA